MKPSWEGGPGDEAEEQLPADTQAAAAAAADAAAEHLFSSTALIRRWSKSCCTQR